MKLSLIKSIWAIKLKACYYIITRKYKHFVIINIDRRNMMKVLEDETFEVNILHSQINTYVFTKMIRMISDSHDDVDMVCAKAEFEAEAIEHYNKNKKELK